MYIQAEASSTAEVSSQATESDEVGRINKMPAIYAWEVVDVSKLNMGQNAHEGNRKHAVMPQE